MLDIILIIALIISFSKPEIFLSKTQKEKANEEERKILANGVRSVMCILILGFESLSLMRYTEYLGFILDVICIILFLVIGIPALKKYEKTRKEVEKR